MSQYQQTYAPAQPTNGLALAGFICSLGGLLVTGGFLCPIGVLLSAVALGRPGGRGLASAGLIIGLVGSCAGIFVAVFAITAIIAAGTVFFLILNEPQRLELTVDMVVLAAAVTEYEARNDELPQSLGGLPSLDPGVLNDPWQRPYRLVLGDGSDYDIVSDGEDRTAATEDDIHLSRLDELWEAAGISGRFSFNGTSIEVGGDGKSGGLTITTGGKTIEMTDEPSGGLVRVQPSTSAPPDPSEAGDDDDGGGF